jgi:hypothetical protein
MTSSRPAAEPISERFPLLWADDDTPDDVRDDLRLTDLQLGTLYRRGKQTRLDRYQQMEDALALQAARNYQATTGPILEVLQELLGGASTLLDATSPCSPNLLSRLLQERLEENPFYRPLHLHYGDVDYAARIAGSDATDSASIFKLIEDELEDAGPEPISQPLLPPPDPEPPSDLSKLRYLLSTIEMGDGLAVGDHRLDAVLTVIDEVGLDPTGIDLFREVVTCLESPASLASLSERHGTSRQAMSVRRQRLARRLTRTREEFAVTALVRVVRERLGRVDGRPADDPFLSIALSPPDGEFPGAVDAVRLGLWLASPEGHGEAPVGYLLDETGALTPR